jgi:hypothetical protein
MSNMFRDYLAKTSIDQFQSGSVLNTLLEMEADYRAKMKLIIFLSKLDSRFKPYIIDAV